HSRSTPTHQPRPGWKMPIRGLTGIGLKRAVAPRVRAGSVFGAADSRLSRSAGCGPGGALGVPLAKWVRVALRWLAGSHAVGFCITPILYCRDGCWGFVKAGKEYLDKPPTTDLKICPYRGD